MHDELTLDRIEIGARARVVKLTAHGMMRRRLLDIGIVVGAPIECVGAAPSGSPRAYLIRGAVIAIRKADSRDIAVEVLGEEES